MKKPVLTPYKPCQELRLEAMDQKIPRILKNIPFGIFFKAENSEKLEENTTIGSQMNRRIFRSGRCGFPN